MSESVHMEAVKELIKTGTLPDPSDRMTPARKASILSAIASGAIRPENILVLYAMSEEELGSWAEKFRHHGQKGLKATIRHRPVALAD